MASSITPQPGIMEIKLYQGGQSTLDGVSDVLKLSSNENPFGPSQAACAALAKAAHQMHRYPSTDHAELRALIGAQYGLNPAQIICGVGSDEIIAFLCYAYAGVGDEVIYTQHGFGMYKINARAAGATPVCVPENERRVDCEAILNAVTPKTRIVFLTNPGNPTGTLLDLAEVADLADRLPGDVLLVLDGAYAEFADGYDGGAGLIETRGNVVMTRTFSKLYGLGGLRVGWGYGAQDVIDVLNRLRGPFNLSAPALAAAEAAIQDQDYVSRCLDENAKWRDWLREALEQVGVPSDRSHANFMLARFASAEEANACNEWLQKDGIIVRKTAGYDLPHCLRITIADEAGSRRVAHSIRKFKEQSE